MKKILQQRVRNSSENLTPSVSKHKSQNFTSTGPDSPIVILKTLSQSGVPSEIQASHQIHMHALSWTPTNSQAKGQPHSKGKYISEKVLTPPIWPSVQKGQRRDPSPTELFIHSFWPASWSDLNTQWRARELGGKNIIKVASGGKGKEWRRHQANFTPGSPMAEPSPHHADQSALEKLKGGLKHANLQDKYILILLEYKLMLNLALTKAYICELRLSAHPAPAWAKYSQITEGM